MKSKKQLKARNKELIKLVRRVKGRGLTPIPPNKIIPNKKQDIIENLIDKEINKE